MPISPLHDTFVLAGDLTFHCVQWGTQGQPVICVHGLTANAFCFQAIADELASNHRVSAYDLRGRGNSAKPPTDYSVPAHAADLARLIEALGVERPVVIGHSLGAMIALYFAAHYPDKLSKLVLIDAGAPLPWQTPEEQPAWLTASISRLGTPVASFEAYKERLQMAPFLGPYWNEYLDIYIEHDVQRNEDGSVTAKAYRGGILEEGRRFSEARLDEQWPRVTVPTLLLRAGKGLFFENDQLLSEEATEAIRQGITQCRYVNFPTLNHYTIIFGTASGPAQEIRSFIDKE
jgi:pimeloyl-ACP methyl ester carboxylesterase